MKRLILRAAIAACTLAAVAPSDVDAQGILKRMKDKAKSAIAGEVIERVTRPPQPDQVQGAPTSAVSPTRDDVLEITSRRIDLLLTGLAAERALRGPAGAAAPQSMVMSDGEIARMLACAQAKVAGQRDSLGREPPGTDAKKIAEHDRANDERARRASEDAVRRYQQLAMSGSAAKLQRYNDSLVKARTDAHRRAAHLLDGCGANGAGAATPELVARADSVGAKASGLAFMAYITLRQRVTVYLAMGGAAGVAGMYQPGELSVLKARSPDITPFASYLSVMP